MLKEIPDDIHPTAAWTASTAVVILHFCRLALSRKLRFIRITSLERRNPRADSVSVAAVHKSAAIFHHVEAAPPHASAHRASPASRQPTIMCSRGLQGTPVSRCPRTHPPRPAGNTVRRDAERAGSHANSSAKRLVDGLHPNPSLNPVCEELEPNL